MIGLVQGSTGAVQVAQLDVLQGKHAGNVVHTPRRSATEAAATASSIELAPLHTVQEKLAPVGVHVKAAQTCKRSKRQQQTADD